MWTFWDKILFVFTFFKSKMNDLLLGTPGHCLIHHCIHYWCDFAPCLTWVDHHFSSYIHCFTIIFVIACDPYHSLHPLVLFLHWPIPGLIFPLHHSCASHYQFDLLHRLIIDIIFTSGTLGPWLTSFSIHVAFYTWGHGFFIIGYLGLIFPHFYYLIILPYVTSHVLRPS